MMQTCISLTTIIGISQWSANYLKVSYAKGIVTYCHPEAIDTHLHTFSRISSTNQPQISMYTCAVAINSNAVAIVAGSILSSVRTVEQFQL